MICHFTGNICYGTFSDCCETFPKNHLLWNESQADRDFSVFQNFQPENFFEEAESFFEEAESFLRMLRLFLKKLGHVLRKLRVF